MTAPTMKLAVNQLYPDWQLPLNTARLGRNNSAFERQLTAALLASSSYFSNNATGICPSLFQEAVYIPCSEVFIGRLLVSSSQQ